MVLEFKTPSSIISSTLVFRTVSSCYLSKFQEKKHFDNLCQTGCPNYEKKWSCPPFAPSYTDFIANYEKIFIFVIFTELKQFSYIKNDYLKVKAANSIMKSRIDKALRDYLPRNCAYISTGSCRLCKPCKCKQNLVCTHPDLMSYSFEALGINVSQMLMDIFDFKLQWYKKGELPEYTSVVAGLLYNDSVDLNRFFEILSY